MDALWDVSSDFKYVPELAVSIPKLSDGTIRIDADVTAECPDRHGGRARLRGRPQHPAGPQVERR